MRVISWMVGGSCVLHAVAPTVSDPASSRGETRPTEESEGAFTRDPINNFRVMHPEDGAVTTNPVELRVEVGIKSIEEYKAHYGERVLCVEISGGCDRKQCTPMLDPSIVFHDLPQGNYTAKAVVTEAGDGVRAYHTTAGTTFSVVSEEVMIAHKAAVGLRREMGLLAWARQERGQWKDHVIEASRVGGGDIGYNVVNNSPGSGDNIFLMIGVKTFVVENFPFRQVIRETWASVDRLPDDVKVMFVGCTPRFSDTQSDTERKAIQDAIELEKKLFGDLLTEELECEDSYADLSNKVKQFLRFAAQSSPQTPFVMIADDDIYLRADLLANQLRNEVNPRQLYIGQVWDKLLGRSLEPVRNSSERYFIPEAMYPLNSYPPFAFGPHYVLSMDCARFIGNNYKKLRGLNAIDDVSVALWLLAMQVHAVHTPAFSSLRIGVCSGGLLSLADVSPFGIRSIHSNVIAKRDLCYGFDRIAWQKSDQLDRSVHIPRWDIRIEVHDLYTFKFLKVTSTIQMLDIENAIISVSYNPSAEPFTSYTRRICSQVLTYVQEIKSHSFICDELALELKVQLQQQFRRLTTSSSVNLAFLELWRYNLFDADPDMTPLIVAYSHYAEYSSVVLECLLVGVYKHHRRPILVMPEWHLREYSENAPDVFIFSILDYDCLTGITPNCQQAIALRIRNYAYGPRPTAIMMLVGEPASTQGLDERVILLSTVSGVTHKRHVYLNVASTSFGERLGHSPKALLSPAAVSMGPQAFDDRRFCAYLYARCDRPQREYMFDVLNAMEPVDALGVCAGSSRLPDSSYSTSRYSDWYNDDAVANFERYKFVIAFENSGVSGYVTEKLVNPFLAGSIPIYLGNSTTVSQLFNPKSFIDCGHFSKLRDCAKYVVKVHQSPELYAQMLHETPIRDVTAFNEAFSWYPSVPSQILANKIAKLLQRTSP
ncbi:unnamed protein product [Phytophthora fragariaefolia]|uniref:Fucosyltransferase n=1 Tax=Phytophthora fragariaefolia TaxID=1490495 RepID=A0A9W7CQH4_9STRA|nr:unnamed protein product [Phytophthora fragariaefolia]